MAGLDKLVEKWIVALKKATDFDSWGQLVEANTDYMRLTKQMKVHLNSIEIEEKKKMISKIIVCLELRSKSLQQLDTVEEIRLEDVKRLDAVLRSLLTSNVQQLPSDVLQQVEILSRVSVSSTVVSSDSPPLENEEADIRHLRDHSACSSLLPKIQMEPGLTYVTVKIVKLGLKDAGNLIDPYFTISCKDDVGLDLCSAQNTPLPFKYDDMYLYYDVDVEMQMAVEHLPKGAALYFHLYHYKVKARAAKLKCFCLMEVDELKSGSCVLEVYKKKSNVKKKKLELMTSRPLYLHVTLSVEKH